MRILAKFALSITLSFTSVIAWSADSDIEKAFNDFHNATLNGDFEGMAKYGSASGRTEMEQMPDELKEMMLAMVKALTPETYEIVDIDVMGETAEISLTGEVDGATTTGIAMMVMEGSEWKVDSVNWEAVGDESFEMVFESEDDAGAVADLFAEGMLTLAEEMTDSMLEIFGDEATVVISEDTATTPGEPPVATAQTIDPDGPATGILNGRPFRVEAAMFYDGRLELREGDGYYSEPGIDIYLFSHLNDLESRGRIMIKPSDAVAPHIHLKYYPDGQNKQTTEVYTGNYAMTLEVRREGLFIDLSFPDANQHRITGIFALR